MEEVLKVMQLSEDDLAAFVDFKNKLSKEDTFVAQSGEILSEESEQNDFISFINEIRAKNAVEITLWQDSILVGNAKIWRMNKYKRNKHVGCCSIALLNEWRGKGYGKKLMKEIMNKAIMEIEGLKLFTLTTYSNNNIAIKLYKDLGFKEWGRLPNAVYYKGKYVDQVEMFMVI
jgi:RimJ/RimL family protein N-acetyltransferase